MTMGKVGIALVVLFILGMLVSPDRTSEGVWNGFFTFGNRGLEGMGQNPAIVQFIGIVGVVAIFVMVLRAKD